VVEEVEVVGVTDEEEVDDISASEGDKPCCHGTGDVAYSKVILIRILPKILTSAIVVTTEVVNTVNSILAETQLAVG
jgi:hypothetical protein